MPVCDQSKKLQYLLAQRGDQRSRDARKPGQVLDDGSSDFLSLCIVTNQASLAEGLGVDPARVNRWVARKTNDPQDIDFENRRKICKIYRIREQAFNEMDYDDFLAHCLGSTVDWHQLVRSASTAHGVIGHEEPVGYRFAELLEDREHASLPSLKIDIPFWIAFESPKTAEGKSVWAGWQALLFGHNKDQSGFICYLPRYSNHSAFGVSVFPDRGGRLLLPRKPVLVHRSKDAGAMFEMVLVVSQDTLPSQVVAAFSREAHGAAIEGDLRELASLIGGPLTQGRAAITKVPYIVEASK